ncbi:hypothetical protein D5085_00300 [Ectothiorhodospiraceae bacterium BW-2]|nr:hypothetical protein D5085_00300 [Ectothiorhodospiraceae bacterium BW-2]
MGQFIPCQGKSACRDDGEHCLVCGRSFDEITRLRDALQTLADLALEYEYDNSSDYSDYIARKLDKMITYRRRESRDD